MGKIGFWQAGNRAADAAAEPREVASRQPKRAAPSGHTAEQLHLLQTYESSGEGWFWSTDRSGCLTYLSERVAPMLCADPAGPIGTAFADLFLPGGLDGESSRSLPFFLAKRSKFQKFTVRAVVAGVERWWSVSGTPQFDDRNEFTGYRGSGVDITEQRRSSESASKLAMHDPLTGLPNRLRMSQVLEANLIALEYQKRSCVVLLVDLDRFKQVNDTLGHPAGDALLKQVAERLVRLAGDGERVFRLGGDEFKIIIRDCQDRGFLGELANQIIASLSQPYFVEGSRCVIGASVGIAISPFDGRTPKDLARNADLALYAAKDGGRGRFSFFSDEMLQAAEDRRALEDDLRDALGKGEIKLFYQPIVSATTNCITGVEALIRWHHATRGPISPALFIPIAEETNLIEPLGEWVLRQACADVARWPGALRVAVNVSAIQFRNDALPQIVVSALASSGLAADRLELEITEGVFLSESNVTDTMFAALKSIGVRLALDDFGTGYSSLSYLKSAPFDKIKIDQSFVREATLPGSRNRAIIAAIVALAEALGMETTAEGIESHDQLDLVRALRVSHVQGYIYSSAIDSAAMNRRLEAGEWEIAPSGPAKQRAKRHAMYKSAGAIFGNYYRPILIRNLSESGALVEGIVGAPLGSLVLIDFGEGQVAFARLRRLRQRQYGIEFEQPLVSDGNGGFCTRERISPYALAKTGVASASAPGTVPDVDMVDNGSMEELRGRLGLSVAPPPMSLAALAAAECSADGAGKQDTGGPGSAPGTIDPTVIGGGSADAAEPAAPTIGQLAERHLNRIGGDKRTQEIDRDTLERDILPRFGKLSFNQATASAMGEWLAIKARDEGCTPAKVDRMQGILAQLYVLAMQWGMTGGGGDGDDGIAIFHRGPQERCLTAAEVERLRIATEASNNPQLKHIVCLLMLTATRQRELLEAHWDDIDLNAAIWRIPTASGKHRLVKLSPAAIGILHDLPCREERGHVIVNPTTRKPYRSFFNSWDTARRKAGLVEIEIDDLRHSALADIAEIADRVVSTDRVDTFLGRRRDGQLTATS